MSSTPETRRVGVRDFARKKAARDPLVVVTAYDALFGRLVDESDVDAVLVGDSVGTTMAGLDSTLPVTLEHMLYHATLVRRGVSRALVVLDMPFLSYQVSVEDGVRNCGRAMQETGVGAVKLEGGDAQAAATIRAVVRLGVPVMGHIGFTPQSVHTLGGFRVQGRDDEGAQRLVDEAKRLEDAGAFSIVLELVPAAVAQRVSESVAIPTIGIGAGVGCDGQVLVLPDLLGLNDGFSPKFLKRYANLADEVRGAVRRFGDDVRARRYPDDDHSF